MIPVQQVMPDALAAVLRRAELGPEKVAFAWRAAVGPAVHHATTVALEDGVLHVEARDAAWRRELQRSAGLIRRRMQALLGEDAVQAISVTSGARRSSSAS